MISMVDSLEGLYKWKGKCTQTIIDGFTRYSGGITKEGVEAIAKYYYYLGACNAFCIARLPIMDKRMMNGSSAERQWLGEVDHDL